MSPTVKVEVPQRRLKRALMKEMRRVRRDENLGRILYQGGYIVRFSKQPGITRKGFLKQPFYFQLPPLEEVRYAAAAEHSDNNVLAGYQLSRPVARQLMQITFRCVFLDYIPTFAAFDHAGDPGKAPKFPNNGPADWVTQLRRLQRSLTPFHVSMGQPRLVGRWEIDGAYTLRQVDVVENAGEPDARYLDISLTEFDPAELDVRQKGDLVVTVFKDGKVRPLVGIQKPPTLAKVSRRVYGTTKHWDAIARASGIKNWTANRDLRDYIRKKRGRDRIKLKCPPKRSERLQKLTKSGGGKGTGKGGGHGTGGVRAG